jgi:phage FluMu protein Com
MTMEMRRFHCPHCQRLLFKGFFADIEIKCKCGELVRVKVYTESALMLTVDSASDMIATVQSSEGNDPDCQTDTT